MSKIAIIILNWNGLKLLEQFLPSVVSFSKEATVYVADNASTDHSVEFVRNNFPTVKIIQNNTNGGYAKGYNDALKHVDADFYCLLNNDVEVTEHWLEPIINTFENQPNTAIVQPKLLDYNKKNHFEYAGAAGGYIDKYGYPFCRGRIFDTIEKDDDQYKDSAIFWASGACLFIRSHVFKALNGFDEAFFAHMEEIDLCWRAYNLKYTVTYVHNSTVYHVGGATLSEDNPKKTFLNFRNSLFTLTKNASGNLFLLVFSRLLLDGVAALKFLMDSKPLHFVKVIQSHISFYGHLPLLLRQRKQLKQTPNYFKINSIVWSYFIKKRKEFDCL